MSPRSSAQRLAAMLGTGLLLAGCSRDLSLLDPAPFPSDPVIFSDGFAPGIGFEAFGGSKTDALSIDASTTFRGSAALRVSVPAPGDASGGFAGGAFVSNVPRDLRQYDALTFWVRASVPAQLNVAGLGNDNTGTSRFSAQRSAVPVGTSWRKVVIPIPLADRLSQERGMFFFAEGAESDAAYDLWIDEIRFETLGTIRNPRPSIASASVSDEVGAQVTIGGAAVTFDVDGADVTVEASPRYFTFSSSNTGVATVTDQGDVAVVGVGTATISASLGATQATGAVNVTAVSPPTEAPPAPTRDAADVVALFSDAYQTRTVDTWSAVWDQADVSDVLIAGNAVKRYRNLAFAGIEFTSVPVDASAMSHLHLDVYVSDVASFRVKLVDFGANGVFGGGDDSEHEITLSGSSNPALTPNTWSSLDIPLSAFAGLTARGHLAQMIIAGSAPTVYLDNVYFYRVPAPTAPVTAAPTPTRPAAQVISLFSDAYTNVPVGTWSAPWDNADVEDVTIDGNAAKKYSNFVFAGIEFTAPTVNATGMTGFHFDYWTPDATSAPAVFKVKLVDFGADGGFGGGDDVEHELTFDATTTPAIRTGEWVSFDIPLSAFTGLVTRGHLAQLIFVSDPNTVFLDNVYFYTDETPSAPLSAAPATPWAAADVIALFSDAYPMRTVDTWSAPWDNADVEDVSIAGTAMKKYTNLVFAGIEFTGATIDATSMTHFSLDLWTPDPTAEPAAFRIKLVDFGADGAFGGGDDREHELAFSAASTPALRSGQWVRFDIPLTAFTGLTTRAHLAQLILVADPNTVFIDNVLLHK
jgi:hypothetical protein